MAMIIIVVLHFEMRVLWLNCKAEYISEQTHSAIWCGINQITITLAHMTHLYQFSRISYYLFWL